MSLGRQFRYQVANAKLLAARGILGSVVGILRRSSDNQLTLLAAALEKVAPNDHYKIQLRQLQELFRQKRPALGLARRIMALHPNCRRSIINNLGINATYRGNVLRKAFLDNHGITPPFLIVISPTMRCNLKCLGCYAGEYPRTDDPLSFATLDRIIREGKEMGVYFYTISGGEPFVRPDLLDLYEKHDDCVFLIYTNGTRITDETISRLQKVGNTAPAISVEGFEKETDFRRGKGVYAKVMETMDKLREAGLFFGFSATATRLNAEAYLTEEFYEKMIVKGCLFGWFFIFVPVGKDSTIDLMVTPEQRDKLRAFTAHIRRTKPLFVADFWNDGCLTGGCMSGGSLYFHVNFRGDLEPCVFMHFAKDNILDLYDRGGRLWDVLRSDLFCRVREVNRKDPNLLRPCPIIDHNEWLAEALRGAGAIPTHDGAEDIIGRLAPELRAWAEVYAAFADRAWDSHEYDFARAKDKAGVLSRGLDVD